jgi:hypothetical protein
MNYAPELLLIGAVASVGVLHTIVLDHWVPITLIAGNVAGPRPKRPTRRFRPAPDKRGPYWESVEEIPEPHGVEVTITIEGGGHAHAYETQFSEHDHGHDHAHMHEHELAPADDPLYAPLRGETAVLTRHSHLQRHGSGASHGH